MFTLIKWSFYSLVIAGIWYIVGFLWNLKSHEIEQVKKDAIHAIDAKDSKPFTDPLTHKIKKDLEEKKASLLEQVKEKLKQSIDESFDSGNKVK